MNSTEYGSILKMGFLENETVYALLFMDTIYQKIIKCQYLNPFCKYWSPFSVKAAGIEI
ncbi:16850_t:CDS:1, partial [Dentiscutata heterogama]